jgi:1,4-dihydroxy-2-naphthoate octaprenyltransferase
MAEAIVLTPLAARPRASAAVWMQAIRGRSLLISGASVLVGGALAFHSGHFDPVRLLLALIAAIAVQTGTNLTNVHYNYKNRGRGAALDRVDPHGSTVVVEKGLLGAAQVWTGALVAFACGAASGVALCWMCGWPLLVVGVVGTVLGYSYGGPPLRLSYVGLGVPTVFVFMGPAMVLGTEYAITGGTGTGAVVVSVSVGLLAAAILHVNDIRDLESDLRNGKRTPSALLGRRGAARALVAAEAIAYLGVVVAVVLGWLPWPTLLVLATIAHAVPQLRLVLRDADQEQLHLAWVHGIRLHMEFGLLMIAGLVLARLLAV